MSFWLYCIAELAAAAWMWRDMLTFVEFPANVELLSTGELRMPFSDAVKYCILGISILLLLVALAILFWQIFRCFSETHTSYPHQDTGQRSRCHIEQLNLMRTGVQSGNRWIDSWIFMLFVVVNTDLLYSEEKPSGAENYASPPSTKVIINCL